MRTTMRFSMTNARVSVESDLKELKSVAGSCDWRSAISSRMWRMYSRGDRDMLHLSKNVGPDVRTEGLRSHHFDPPSEDVFEKERDLHEERALAPGQRGVSAKVKATRRSRFLSRNFIPSPSSGCKTSYQKPAGNECGSPLAPWIRGAPRLNRLDFKLLLPR